MIGTEIGSAASFDASGGAPGDGRAPGSAREPGGQRYRIEEELGAGGAGTVYRAVQISSGRAVALKVLLPELTSSPEQRARFEREVKALAAVSHPGIVAIVDSGVDGSTPYLVMDLLKGETLADRLRRGAVPYEEAVDVLRQLLGALAFVHGRGLIHRDVKPANVFIEQGAAPGARVRLLDFGLAKFIAPEVGDRTVTRAGQIFGTPAYMAPEQVAGQPADARVDVYAAGIILFEMLSGKAPFSGPSSEVLRQQVMDDLPLAALPAAAAVPEVVEVLRRATAKTRAERFANAGEMLAALPAPHPLARADEVPTEEAPASGVVRTAMRLVTGFAAVVSLTAIVGAAISIYVFVAPERARERRAIEAVLGPPARSAPVPSGSARPPAPRALASVKMPPATGTDRVASSAAPATLAPVAASAPAPVPPLPARPPATDPWTVVPPELGRLLTKLNRGRWLEKREIVAVHKYNAHHPDDPRGHLLLARSHLKRRWFKDATSEYAVAYRVGEGARGDPRMLPDLVTLVGQGAQDASRLLTDAYGAEALPAIDRALAAPRLPSAARTRLEKLRPELAR